VFLQNYHALAIFYNYRIIFLLKISWNRSTVRYTESTVAGAWVHGLSLNESCRLPGQRLRLKKNEGISHNLIVVVNVGMDDSRWLGRQGRRTQPAVATHWSKPLPTLRSTKLNKVFTYGIVETWGIRFAHLGTAADGGGGWRRLATARRFGWLWASNPASSGAPLVKMKAPKGVVVFDDPSGMVDLARAVAHRRNGELHTAARVLTTADQNSS
jgi:hypothetical protein